MIRTPLIYKNQKIEPETYKQISHKVTRKVIFWQEKNVDISRNVSTLKLTIVFSTEYFSTEYRYLHPTQSQAKLQNTPRPLQ